MANNIIYSISDYVSIANLIFKLKDNFILNKFILIVGKEQRRKELKKNKKQRMAVRHAVLKGKDTQKLITDLDELDDMGQCCLSICVSTEMVQVSVPSSFTLRYVYFTYSVHHIK